MKTQTCFFVPLILLLCACTGETKKSSSELWKDEIMEVERSFADMAGREGLSEAFLAYAAEDAVVMRGNELVMGRENLRTFLNEQAPGPPDEQLDWKPDFVDVSASGDLAYTYGRYTYSYTDSTGATISSEGIFHTVWKRQADGSWRFVWD